MSKSSTLKTQSSKRKKVYGTTKGLSLDYVKSLIRRYPNANAKEIAQMLGIGRSTFLDWLKKQGLTFNQLREIVERELEEKYQKEIERKEKKELPPTSFEEFLEYESVKEIMKRLNVSPLSEGYRKRVLQWIYDVCRTMGVAPTEIDSNVLIEYANKVKERYSDENSIRIMIKTVAKWLNIKLPPYVEVSEYKGKYVTAELSRDLRRLFIETAKKILKKEDFELVHDVVLILFRGGRRESLTTMRWDREIELPIKPYKFMAFTTEEKGKKGRKLKWTRLMPLEEYRMLYNPKRFPLSVGDVKRVERLMRKVFKKLLEEYSDLMNRDTIEYLQKGKVFHIWRHTSAREYLKSLNWNRYLVSKLLGWEKSDNLRIYGDFSAIEILQNFMRKEPEIPPFF